jgi:hypothetical protein
MPFQRHTESQLRQLVRLLQLVDDPDPHAIATRLEQLRRGLAPEDEFSLVLSWLGKCRLVHKLGQEQLPLASTQDYRVPDLVALFEHDGKIVPTLVEVKKTDPADPLSLEPGWLSLKPGLQRYAEALGLPMLIAWKHRTFWSLFEMRHAKLGEVNYRIDFQDAMKQNLLGILAGDFSYRVVPGTAIRLRFHKLSEPDEAGGFDAEIQDPHFVNSSGERIPNIPHLSSLFLFWDNDVEQVDEGDAIVQSFVIPETDLGEFASRTLSKIVHAIAGFKGAEPNWPAITHDAAHFAHETGGFRRVAEEGAKHGVISHVFRQRPQEMPRFL